MVTSTSPVLLRFTSCWLLDPTVTLLKLMLVGLMLSCGFGAGRPVPEREIVTPLALLAMVTLPVIFPELCGVNCTENAAFCPGLRMIGIEMPLRVNPAPEAAACVMATFTLPVLLRFTGCWLLDPTFTLPKLMLVGLMASCGFAEEEAPLPAQPLKLTAAKKPMSNRL